LGGSFGPRRGRQVSRQLSSSVWAYCIGIGAGGSHPDSESAYGVPPTPGVFYRTCAGMTRSKGIIHRKARPLIHASRALADLFSGWRQRSGGEEIEVVQRVRCFVERAEPIRDKKASRQPETLALATPVQFQVQSGN